MITLGSIYFYNNRPVVPLFSTEKYKNSTLIFYLCQVFEDDMQLEGSQWCHECMAGNGYATHVHDEYQDVIDVLNESKIEGSVFWIREDQLKNERIEYKRLNEIETQIKEGHKALNNVLDSIVKEEGRLSGIVPYKNSVIKSKIKKIRSMNKVISDLKKEIKELNENRNTENIVLRGRSISLSFDRLVDLLEKEVVLRQLDTGGVDNWTWYSDSTDFEKARKEAIEEAKDYLIC